MSFQGGSKPTPIRLSHYGCETTEVAMVMKTVRCDCGFVVRSDDDDKLVAELQKHARVDHNMNLSRDQVLAMAQPEPPAAGAKRKT
jgi:predicted small metal-binding protein